MNNEDVWKRSTRQTRKSKLNSAAGGTKGEAAEVHGKKEEGERLTRNTRGNRKRTAAVEAKETSDKEQKEDQSHDGPKNKKTRRKGRGGKNKGRQESDMEKQVEVEEHDGSEGSGPKTRNARRRNTRQHVDNQEGENDEVPAEKTTKLSKAKEEVEDQEDSSGAEEDNGEVNDHVDVVGGDVEDSDEPAPELESELFMEVKQRSSQSAGRRSFELVQLAVEFESEKLPSQDKDQQSAEAVDAGSPKPALRGRAKSKSSSSDENPVRKGRSKSKGASGGEDEKGKGSSKSKDSSRGSEDEHKRGGAGKKRSSGSEDYDGSKSQGLSADNNRKRVRSRSKSASSSDGEAIKGCSKSNKSSYTKTTKSKINGGLSKSSKAKKGQSKRKTSSALSVDDGDVPSLYDFEDGDDDVSHSVVIQPVNSQRLSWQKSPSELSPINPDIFDEPKNNRTKNGKANKRKTDKQKTNKQKSQTDRSRRKRKADTSEVAESKDGDGSTSEVIAKKMQRSEVVTEEQGQRGRRKSKTVAVEDIEVDPEPQEADSVSHDMLESEESTQSTSSERDGEGSDSGKDESDKEEENRRASCVLKMGKQHTVKVMVHATVQGEGSTMDMQPEGGESSVKGLTPSIKSADLTPRSILKRANSKKTSKSKSRRLTLKFFDQPKKKGYLVEPEKTNGLRRTKRTRVQTLEYWRNERPLYERRKSGGFALVGVLSSPHSEPKKTKPRKKQRNLSTTPSNVSMHMATPPRAEKVPSSAVLVVNPDTDEEVEVDAIVTSKMHNYVGPSGKVADPNDPITICKCLHQPTFSTGFLKIRPYKEKSTQLVKRNTMVFYIIHGKLSVTIHNTTQILQTGDSFFVPQGNLYNIKNLRKDEAKLKFFQLKNA